MKVYAIKMAAAAFAMLQTVVLVHAKEAKHIDEKIQLKGAAEKEPTNFNNKHINIRSTKAKGRHVRKMSKKGESISSSTPKSKTALRTSTTEIPAPCDRNSQCKPRIRSQDPSPHPVTGVRMCNCYAASTIEPFDECEGHGVCRRARCDVKNIRCYELKAYCAIRPGEMNGRCSFLETENESDSKSILKEKEKKVHSSSAVSLRGNVIEAMTRSLPDKKTDMYTYSCPNTLDKSMKIPNSQSTLYYAIVDDHPSGSSNGILCGRLEVDNHDGGWVGLGFSPNGQMLGQAVIGIHDGSVLKYDLVGYQTPQLSAKQTLRDASINEVDGKTVMTFTKLLVEEGEVPIKTEGTNHFLHAWGDGSELVYHGPHRTAFSINFDIDDVVNMMPQK